MADKLIISVSDANYEKNDLKDNLWQSIADQVDELLPCLLKTASNCPKMCPEAAVFHLSFEEEVRLPLCSPKTSDCSVKTFFVNCFPCVSVAKFKLERRVLIRTFFVRIKASTVYCLEPVINRKQEASGDGWLRECYDQWETWNKERVMTMCGNCDLVRGKT